MENKYLAKMKMNGDLEQFINWNRALFEYFFSNGMEGDDAVSLYIDNEIINNIGNEMGLGGYDDFISLIMLPKNRRMDVYMDLRRLYCPANLNREQRIKLNSDNLFDFATIYIDNSFYNYLACPFLVYIVFVVLAGGECYSSGRTDIGNYITEQLRANFPDHTDRRNSINELFNSLAETYPRFRANRSTGQQYIGLIKYQLGLSPNQENILNKAMYCADLSEILPYDIWVCKIKYYVNDQMRDLLERSRRDAVLRKRVSDLRSCFDPSKYEQRNNDNTIISRGKFVLAVFEDEYTADADRLVLLTDINNKTISNDNLKITKGTLDRLGEYEEYNVNHVFIGNSDKAEMRIYTLNSDENRITSMSLGNVVTFSRCSDNYLIQTEYPCRGKETYILVRNGHDEYWRQWQETHGSPTIRSAPNEDWVHRVFGRGWNMYISEEIEYVQPTRNNANRDCSIIMDGGIRCVGMYNMYLLNGLPYFEFPEPIISENLEIDMTIDGNHCEQYTTKIVENNKLVFDLGAINIGDDPLSVEITLNYNNENGQNLSFSENFSVKGQDVYYNGEDLFKIDMWGNNIAGDDQVPYIKGFELINGTRVQTMFNNTGFYQNNNVAFDFYDRRFYLINLIAAECSTRTGFSITEARLKKCIRYAATRFDINMASIPSFYTNIKYLLINCGYINADFEQGRYQPIPPTFIKTSVGLDPKRNLFMLVGSYTRKFLVDLKNYCSENNISIYFDSICDDDMTGENLMPPVILIQHIFNPELFMNNTNSMCMFIDDDVAISVLRTLPTYNDYYGTLQHIEFNVVGRLEDTRENIFPRIRNSAARFGSKWIELANDQFYRVTITDMAWANLYCRYRRGRTYLIKDYNRLMFPIKLHLPIMTQRALYILNFGIPIKEKAFICNNDAAKGYYNIIKRYNIKDDNCNTRTPVVIETITGRRDDDHNPLIRRCITFNGARGYKIYFWKNLKKQSRYPRSLLILTNITGRMEYGIGIGEKINGNDETDNITYKIYLRQMVNPDNPYYNRIDSDNINNVFSRIISSFTNFRLEYILADTDRIHDQLGVTVINENLQLPPREEYEIEEIKIV